MVSVQRHVALMRALLRADEAERLWIRAERLGPGHAGALLLTDRRLLFSGLGFVAQSQESWPLPVVTDVRVADGVLRMRALGQPERFGGKARDLARLAEALPAVAGEPAAASVVDELERLAALRGAGVLTEQEFEAAKRRLLQ